MLPSSFRLNLKDNLRVGLWCFILMILSESPIGPSLVKLADMSIPVSISIEPKIIINEQYQHESSVNPSTMFVALIADGSFLRSLLLEHRYN